MVLKWDPRPTSENPRICADKAGLTLGIRNHSTKSTRPRGRGRGHADGHETDIATQLLSLSSRPACQLLGVINTPLVICPVSADDLPLPIRFLTAFRPRILSPLTGLLPEDPLLDAANPLAGATVWGTRRLFCFAMVSFLYARDLREEYFRSRCSRKKEFV